MSDPSPERRDAAVRRYGTLEERLVVLGGYAAEAEAARPSAPAWACPTACWPSPCARSPAASAAGSSWPGSCSRTRRHAAARRADQPPGRRLDRLAARLPAHIPRRAGGDQPRRRAAGGGGQQGLPPGRQPGRARRLQRRLEDVPGTARDRRAAPQAGARPTPSRRRPRCRRRRTRCGPRRPRPGPRRTWTPGAERLLAGLERGRVARTRSRGCVSRSPAPCGKTPLTAEDLSKSYGSLEVFADVDVAVDRGARVVVLGLNGAGKTTLLRLLAGLEQPDTGEVTPGHGLRLGYYAQEHETLDVERTVLENMRVGRAGPDRRRVAGHPRLVPVLRRRRRQAGRRAVRRGEDPARARPLVVSGANVLLLDEPTNNLDPAAGRRSWMRCAATGARSCWSPTTRARWRRCRPSG